jgi:hypothetical protein
MVSKPSMTSTSVYKSPYSIHPQFKDVRHGSYFGIDKMENIIGFDLEAVEKKETSNSQCNHCSLPSRWNISDSKRS